MAYSSITKPSDHFNTVLYTGTGSELAITGLGFQPDWVSIKRRDNNAHGGIFDVVRGATKLISSSTNAAEQTLAQTLKSFDSDGFTLGTGGNGYVNESSSTAVAWCWKAGNSQGSSNTDGSITSTVSANQTAGFSIVSYTGTGSSATVGHGLGTTPAMVIVKNRSEAFAWNCYHQSLGATKYILLNATDASATGTTWNDTAPTSSVFSIGSTSGVNKNTNNLIAYCFAEKTGYSKFGSYTGNGNADGAFVYTGFKPSMVIYKKSSGTENWFIHDNKRQGFNPDNELLFPDLPTPEGTVNRIDLLSNGFKATTSDGGINGSGATYIYMAFAAEPLVANVGGGVPATAR